MAWEGLCPLSHRSDFAETSKAGITNNGDGPHILPSLTILFVTVS